MSFFSRLTAAAVSSVSAVANAGINALEAVSNEITSLDQLQVSHGDPSGKKALYKGLDFTYLTPRLIGNEHMCVASLSLISQFNMMLSNSNGIPDVP